MACLRDWHLVKQREWHLDQHLVKQMGWHSGSKMEQQKEPNSDYQRGLRTAHLKE